MEKEFVPYQQAVSLKELGFDEPSLRGYDKNDQEYLNDGYCKNSEEWLNGLHCSAPLYQQAFRWFREKYDLHSEILLDQTTQPKYCFEIHKYEDFGNYEEIRIGEWFLYRTYEEAELACLVGLIEIVKNSK